MNPKTLIFDIETAPPQAYFWKMWKENIGLDQLISEGYVICWAAKWLDDDKIMTDALPNYSLDYAKDKENDKNIVSSLWNLMDEADIVVGHNGKKFDVPTMNSRFVLHGMKPPSNYKIVDTLLIAKAKFRFLSNRLDALGRFLKVGRKAPTGGFNLWVDVMAGDKEAWDNMIKYNVQDVQLLEEVYKALRPWDSQHPSVAIYGEQERPMCNVCGSEKVIKKGFDHTKVHTYRRWKCGDCGHNMRERHNVSDKDKNKNILRSV